MFQFIETTHENTAYEGEKGGKTVDTAGLSSLQAEEIDYEPVSIPKEQPVDFKDTDIVGTFLCYENTANGGEKGYENVDTAWPSSLQPEESVYEPVSTPKEQPVGSKVTEIVRIYLCYLHGKFL